MAAVTLAIAYKEDKSMIDKCGHGYKLITGVVTFDGGTYATNGTALDLSKQLPTEVHMVIFDNAGGYIYQYDYTNKKVKVYYFDYNNANDAVAIELANGVAISTTPRFVAIGK